MIEKKTIQKPNTATRKIGTRLWEKEYERFEKVATSFGLSAYVLLRYITRAYLRKQEALVKGKKQPLPECVIADLMPINCKYTLEQVVASVRKVEAKREREAYLESRKKLPLYFRAEDDIREMFGEYSDAGFNMEFEDNIRKRV